MPFPMTLAQNKMHLALPRIWTRVTDSIPYVDSCYAVRAFKSESYDHAIH